MDEMIQLMGLWENVDKKGCPYFSGNIGNVKVMIFKNTFKKEGSKEPDYRLYVAKRVKQEDKEEAPF